MLDGIVLGLITILTYYAVFIILNFTLGNESYIISFLILAVAAFSLGIQIVIGAKGAARSTVSIVAFILTIFIASRYLDVAEIYILGIVTIVTSMTTKIYFWIKER